MAVHIDSGGVGGSRAFVEIEDGIEGTTVSVLCELIFCCLLKGFCPAIGVTREVGEVGLDSGLAAIGARTGLLLEAGGGGAGARFLFAAASLNPDEAETSVLGGGCIVSWLNTSCERKKGFPELD